VENKLAKLRDELTALEQVVIAYSGGVDSTFLLFQALQELGKENVLAVIAESPTYPQEEIAAAIILADKLGVECRQIKTEEFSDENFLRNSKERCYFCKKELFAKLKQLALEKGITHLADGSNFDDLRDFRPGSKAKLEFGVRSPLQEAGLTKAEIRELSRQSDLPTWDKPSLACLSSRIPYGTRITLETLAKIGWGEEYLKQKGFKQVRVRHHGSIARIELEEEFIPLIMENGLMPEVTRYFEGLGYFYVTLDLKGYRTGSLNEEVSDESDLS